MFVPENVYGNRNAGVNGNELVVSEIDVTDNRSWKQGQVFEAHKKSVEKVTWNLPEFGTMLASCSKNDFAIWEEIEEIVEIKFSPMQLQLAVGYADGKIKIYEGDYKGNWTVLQHFQALDGPVNSISWAPISSYRPMLVAGGNEVKIWLFNLNLLRWQVVSRIEAFDGVITSVAWVSRNGENIIATGGTDAFVRLWRVQVNTEIDEIVCTLIHESNLHKCAVRSLNWDAIGSKLSSYGVDGRVRVWNENAVEWVCSLEYDLRGL